MIKFLEVNESYKPDCSDGTKCCFMFACYDKVDEFVTELKKRINADVTKDSYIGYKTIYVPIEKYEEAVIEGLNIILNDKSYETAGAYWVNCYDERSCWEDEQILKMVVSPKSLDKKGFWTRLTKREIEKWKEKLEKVLDKEVVLVESFGSTNFFIKRTTPSEHVDILNKIRNSNIIEESPFGGYALIDYYGEHVEI